MAQLLSEYHWVNRFLLLQFHTLTITLYLQEENLFMHAQKKDIVIFIWSSLKWNNGIIKVRLQRGSVKEPKHCFEAECYISNGNFYYSAHTARWVDLLTFEIQRTVSHTKKTKHQLFTYMLIWNTSSGVLLCLLRHSTS